MDTNKPAGAKAFGGAFATGVGTGVTSEAAAKMRASMSPEAARKVLDAVPPRSTGGNP
jgi:hypothetical protein